MQHLISLCKPLKLTKLASKELNAIISHLHLINISCINYTSYCADPTVEALNVNGPSIKGCGLHHECRSNETNISFVGCCSHHLLCGSTNYTKQAALIGSMMVSTYNMRISIPLQPRCETVSRFIYT